MNKLDFYTIQDDYIAYLSTYDKRVCYNKNHKRPYIGIIFKVYNINYFAPFTSPKPKHKTMNRAIDYIKIDNGNLGLINLNNMIPVSLDLCEKIKVKDVKNDKYNILIQKQYKQCNKKDNYEDIIKSARRLYHFVTNNNCGDNLKARCCDYKLLESKYLLYKKSE